jgi:hypothetical protein
MSSGFDLQIDPIHECGDVSPLYSKTFFARFSQTVSAKHIGVKTIIVMASSVLSINGTTNTFRPTFEFTGLRGFLRRSGGMMGWGALSVHAHAS